ncbi:MAG: beta-ketoacyl-ACP synthase III [Opitutales bacterium]
MASASPASIVIEGLGTCIPERVMTNKDLTELVDTSDEWIFTRTGIRERRIAAEHQATSDLAAAAGQQALERAGVPAGDIDLLIVATCTPDMAFPSTACLVQARLGIPQTTCFDMEAACSGFVYALEVATALLRTGRHRKALVIGAEKLSAITDWTDRTTCVLFGDGAGAAVLGRSDTPGIGILDTLSRADGSDPSLLNVPAGGSRRPITPAVLEANNQFIRMKGRELFKVVVRVVNQIARDIIIKNGLTNDDIDYVVPHQANVRMIESMSGYLEIPMERFIVNLDRYGNTSAASVPIALEEAASSGRIQSGSTVLLIAFGAGLTWAASLIKWP